MIASLADPDPTKRASAAESLSQLGPGALEAAVSLVKACGDASAEVRQWAAAALEEMGPPAPADVEDLVELLRSKEYPIADVAYWAATLLGRLEDEAADACDALAAAVNGHADIAVRQRAAWALGHIRHATPAVREALNKAAASDNARLARLAKDALQAIR